MPISISVAALLLASTLSAVETKSWQQGSMSDYDKAKLTRLSLRSDGRLTVAPMVKELHDASAPYLWGCAQDSKGNLYVGGGSMSGASEKLLKIDPATAKATTIAELDGLEIHAVAVDKSDNVYAATAPDGKIYRVRPGQKAEVFYDPKAKYIWALVFAPNGDLYAATGDHGDIHRIAPDGKGSVFFHTGETHIRSLTLDGKGNLIAGTEPGGLVIRIGADGKGFVLYQTPKREVTAVAVGKDGNVWAAAIGNKGSGAPFVPSAAPAAAPPPSPAAAAVLAPIVAARAAAAAAGATAPTAAPAIAGGTELYRIAPDGYAQRIWQHATDIVYDMAFDAQDHLLLASGNKGNLYRIDSDRLHTLVTSLAPTQITSLLVAKSGAIFAVTGNIGKVFQIGPQLDPAGGTMESEPFDAGWFTYWGRVSLHATDGVKFESRSGNVSSTQENWSPWQPVTLKDRRGRIESPAARFLQVRATLAGTQDLTWMDLAYQARNIAPTIEQVEITPPNYRFPQPVILPSNPGAAPTLSLPALGSRSGRTTPVNPADLSTSSTLNSAKGYMGARWLARDENGDTLLFKVEIRGVKETEWKLLKDNVRERYISFDSTAYADGEYLIRVTAEDSPSNTPQDTLRATLESEEFLVDNGAPKVTALTGQIAANNKLNIAFTARDEMSIITKAEYSINGGPWIVAEPVTRLSDAAELNYKFTIDKPAPAVSEYTIAVRVTDEFDNQAVEKVTAK
ncbi:hypothetical protein F183_A24120 [Bryobacterales bacterium F-183]|nr:hypothetical protein F183_A24120 [Bryobacterales bacterium F-183]